MGLPGVGISSGPCDSILHITRGPRTPYTGGAFAALLKVPISPSLLPPNPGCMVFKSAEQPLRADYYIQPKWIW